MICDESAWRRFKKIQKKRHFRAAFAISRIRYKLYEPIYTVIQRLFFCLIGIVAFFGIIGIIGIVAVDGIVAGVLIRFEVGARGCRLFVIEPVFVKPEDVDDFASEREVDGDVIAGDGEIEDVVDRIAGFERLGELDLVFARGR